MHRRDGVVPPEIARLLVNRGFPAFFKKKGAGIGDKATKSYTGELQRRASRAFSADHAEQAICGTNKLCVDYYFRAEATIVEVAMSLRNPTSEFERDT